MWSSARAGAARWRARGRLTVLALGMVMVSGTTTPAPSSQVAPATSCSTASSPQGTTGARPMRALAVGFEDLTRPRRELTAIDARSRRARVDTVAISAGRMDWTAFPWPAHPDAASPVVRSSGRDLLAEAIGVLGTGRTVSVVVDVLAERYIAAHPEVAARDARGVPVTTHVSTVELVEGEAGRRILAMVDHVARTYQISSVDLTELYYRDEGYGEDDARSYRLRTGRQDWPRLAGGAVDTMHPSIGQWRSEMVATFVQRAADLVHAQGKELIVDVRPSWSDLNRAGRENGQCYGMLLAHADRLAVWNYSALEAVPVDRTTALATSLNRIAPGRFVMAVGLWGRRGSATPSHLESALTLSQRANVNDLWVTPQSLMTDSHWRVLEKLWK